MKRILLSVITIFLFCHVFAQQVTSISIIPSPATSADHLQAVITTSFPGGPCTFVSAFPTTQSNDTIILDGIFCYESGSGGCTRIDTFDIGQRAAGTYVIRFRLTSTAAAGPCGSQIYMLRDIGFQAFTVTQGSGSTPQVSSISVIPTPAVSNASLQAVVALSFPGGPCAQVSSAAATQSNDTIILNATYCYQSGSGGCTASDTFLLGQLPAGDYVVRFNLMSTAIAGTCGSQPYTLQDTQTQTFTVNQGDSARIVSINVIPAAATASSAVKAVVSTSYPGGPCNFVSASPAVLSNDTVTVTATYCFLSASGGCTATDTFDLGQLAAGSYVVQFRLNSTAAAGACGSQTYTLRDTDYATFTVSPDDTTRIGNIPHFDVSIAPNPVTDQLTFTFERKGEAELTLYDTGGKTVKKAVFKQGERALLQVADLPSNVYFYTIKTGEYRVTGRIVVH